MPQTKVFWYTLKQPKPRKPDKDHKSDVLVVGGGMAGLMCARSFLKQGKSVVLLEKDFCGAGASGKSSGFITPDSELELGTLISGYGLEEAGKLWKFACRGVDLIRECIEEYRLDCDYQVQDSLFVANTSGKVRRVKEEYEARKSLNYEASFYPKENLGAVIGSQKYHGAVSYPDTFGICSYSFCQGLKDSLADSGADIFEDAVATKIDRTGAWAGQYHFEAETVIFCGDRFIPEFGKLKRDIYHGQTFLAVSKPLSDRDVLRIFPGKKLMVWDTDLIYQYYRITGDNRLLIGGASLLATYATHETDPSGTLKKLSRYFNDKFPGVKTEFEYVWPGLIGVTKDFLPVIHSDEESPNVYFVGAGAGLPWSAAIGEYVSEKILQQRNELDKYFTVGRFSISDMVQRLLGTRLTFAICQGWKKFF